MLRRAQHDASCVECLPELVEGSKDTGLKEAQGYMSEGLCRRPDIVKILPG